MGINTDNFINMTNLIEYANEVIKKYPVLESDIQGLIDLCIMEIEEGSPEQHEMELCWSDIDQLVKEEDAKILSRNI
jgi:spore coat protein CotH